MGTSSVPGSTVNCEAAEPSTDYEKQLVSSEGRHFDKAFLRTWPAVFKITESVFCFSCFICNEATYLWMEQCRARAFLSVCACFALISSILLFLVCGYHTNRHSNTSWRRTVMVAAPGTCALLLMISSSIFTGIFERNFPLDGLMAATVLGFLASITYMVDAVYSAC